MIMGDLRSVEATAILCSQPKIAVFRHDYRW